MLGVDKISKKQNIKGKYEREKMNPVLISPKNKVKLGWDFILAILFLLSLLLDTWNIGYDLIKVEFYSSFIATLDAWFLLDNTVALLTTYSLHSPKRRLQTSLPRVILYRLKGRFLPDSMLSILGFFLPIQSSFYYFRLLRYPVRFRQFQKVKRRILRGLTQNKERRKEIHRLCSLVSFLFIIFLIFHLVSCISLLIGLKNLKEEGWLSEFIVDSDSYSTVEEMRA